MSNVLLHICCAPCLARTRTGLAARGDNPDCFRGWFHNPNIHPLIEFRRRLKALAVYRTRDPFAFAADRRYGLASFLAAVGGGEALAVPGGGNFPGAEDAPPQGPADGVFPPPFAPPERCRRCLFARMRAAAARAVREGCGRFMSTLQSSRELNHDWLREAGERAAREAGVRFDYLDCRGHEPPEAAMRGVYRQSYCGCVFSEAERYAGTRLHLPNEA